MKIYYVFLNYALVFQQYSPEFLFDLLAEVEDEKRDVWSPEWLGLTALLQGWDSGLGKAGDVSAPTMLGLSQADWKCCCPPIFTEK